jgi:hypothetical protein
MASECPSIGARRFIAPPFPFTSPSGSPVLSLGGAARVNTKALLRKPRCHDNTFSVSLKLRFDHHVLYKSLPYQTHCTLERKIATSYWPSNVSDVSDVT